MSGIILYFSGLIMHFHFLALQSIVFGTKGVYNHISNNESTHF